MDNYSKFEKRTTFALFFFVFIYLSIRVFYNETLHDEIATYMFFIYQGDYWGDTIVWDANNHLLNSFIGNQLYPLFKDHISLYRLPNLLAFILYFFGLKKILKDLITKNLRLIALITCCSFSIIIDYFALCRGYGLSLGVFVWALVNLKNYARENKSKYILYTYIFLILAISANLTFITTGLFICLFIIFDQLMKGKSISIRNHVYKILMHLPFILACSIFIKVSFELKKHGALYYGSLDGIWDVTGKSLQLYFLYVKNDQWMYFYLILFCGLIIVLVKSLYSKKLTEYLKSQFLIYSLLFFGNMVAILFLALVLKVNYPEDRTAFYLVIPFFLMLFYCIDQLKFGSRIQYIFLLFPCLFIFHLNIHSSSFSPEQRMTDLVYQKVKKELKPNESLMIYHTMAWNWPFRESLQKIKSSVSNISNPNAMVTDYIITNTDIFKNRALLYYYDTLIYDPSNTYIAFKRKIPLIKNLLYTSPIVSHKKMSQEFIQILEEDSLNRFSGKSLQISVQGKLKTYAPKNKIQLVLQTFDKANLLTNNLYYSFETTYQGKMIDDSFLHHFVVEKIKKNDFLLKVYLWDRKNEQVQLDKASCQFYELINPAIIE